MYFLIITFGLILAMRGSRPARIDRPSEGIVRVWCEATDFFLTVSLSLALLAAARIYKSTHTAVEEYALLGLGVVVYLLSRYQKKTEVFSLAAMVVVLRSVPSKLIL